jgi:two-component system, NtrC family, sensor kinase
MALFTRQARYYLYTIWALAGTAIIMVLASTYPPFPIWLLLGGLAAFIIGDFFAVKYRVGQAGGIMLTVVDSLLIFLAVTIGPIGVLIAFLGSLISDALLRQAWYKSLFNAAQRVLGYLLLVLIYQLVGISGGAPFAGWQGLMVLTLMMGSYIVINPLLVSIIVALISEQPLLKVYASSISQVQWVHMITLPLGAVLAVIWYHEPWMLPPAMLPLVMAYRSFKAIASLQVESDRSKELAEHAQRLAGKLERLQDTTTAMLATNEPQPLLGVVSRRLANLLGAQAAWVILAENPPRLAVAHDLPEGLTIDCAAFSAELRHQRLRHIDSQLERFYAAAPAPWPHLLIIPMLAEGRLVGGFGLALSAAPQLEQDDRRVLLAFAAQAALAVERTQLFDQLRSKQEELIRTSKLAALGTFAAGIAHEFNNLLTAISGFAQLGLLSNDLTEKDEALEVARRTSTRGQSITAGLLTFARRREPRREICQVRDVIEETIILIERELAKSNLRVQRAYSSVPAIVCDSGQIAQIVMNLLTNARDAMTEQGGGTITVGLRPYGSSVELTISDTGHGIPAELLPQIFQPFMTTKSADSGHSSGSGLGLAIISSIVESHHGEIVVQSAPGTGTTVIVRLPISIGDERPADDERAISA